MVIYSDVAIQDLEDILYGLVTWKKHPLAVEHALQYVDELHADADTICLKFYHANTTYLLHQKYGNKAHTYKRNVQTQWYVIYEWMNYQRVALVNKILNNYQTEI
ncbi:hypothetical protein FACS189413_10860 [Bacteroidia bacterium]|nr:hypothetical protein FACS189413_10860 [Bacteroidia bacterium]